MRIGDFLFFAPGLSFSQLDLADRDLGEAWEKRIEGYYLAPAKLLLDKGHVFAGGGSCLWQPSMPSLATRLRRSE